MWVLVLGAVGAAVVIYELWTHKNVDEAQKAPAAPSSPLGPLRALPTYTPPVPKVGAKAIATCGLLPTDMADADKWSATFLSASLPLPNRLNLMRSVVPGAQWPESARRTWCALVNEGLV